MKILVEHDANGLIHAVAISMKDGSATTALLPGPHRHVSEVEAPEVTDEKDYENLQKIRSVYNIEGGGSKSPRLVRKPT
jgi:hypothetical protein